MANIKLFESKRIRSVWSEGEKVWYFVVEDVVAVLTDSSDPKQYVKRMRQRDEELAKGWVQIVPTLLVETSGGKQKMGCASTKGLLRIIQSIPSPKAEPFKLWLAQVGSDRLDEIENPELAAQRTRELYKLKGYSEDWIEKRMRSIAIREELTDSWNKRGVKEQKEYAILTSEISKATFGLKPKEYKKVKGLKNQNLRDHMTDLELIFSMLGEASTKAIVDTKNPIGFTENKKVAKQGGDVAGNARKDLEMKTGKKVVSTENYLQLNQKTKQVRVMKQEPIKTIIQQFIEATNQFDVKTALTLFAKDAVIDDVSVGQKFKNKAGVQKYLDTYFVGYKTQTKLESLKLVDKTKAIAQVDFTGDFGHETGALKFTINTDGLIVLIDAHLD